MAAASTAVEVRKPKEARRKDGAGRGCEANAVIGVSVRSGQGLTPGAITRLSPEELRPHPGEDRVTRVFRMSGLRPMHDCPRSDTFPQHWLWSYEREDL